MVNLKKCSRCGIEKPETEFSLRMSTKNGLMPRTFCMTCEGGKFADSEESKAYQKQWKMMDRYGVTPEQVQAMGEAQEWVCPISGTDIREKYYIDHDHATGKVRQLLCFHCNVGLGHFKDSTELMTKAITYLEQHSDKSSERL